MLGIRSRGANFFPIREDANRRITDTWAAPVRLDRFPFRITSRCNAGRAPQVVPIWQEQWSLEMDEATEVPTKADQPHREQRTVPRYAFIAHVDVVEPASDTRIAARVSEISRKGCYVDVLVTLPASTLIQLKILRDRGTFTTKGKIIYVQEGMGMGVAFVDIAEDQLKILDGWLVEIAS
jgi:PilZ domain